MMVQRSWHQIIHPNCWEIISWPHLNVHTNVYYYILMARSFTGILHLLNQTPINLYSKKQPTIETAMYGFKSVFIRPCTYHFYLGVLVHANSYMLEITSLWLIVQSFHTLSYCVDTQHYYFTKQLHWQCYFFDLFLEIGIQLMLSANIGDTVMFGSIFSCYCFGRVIPWTWITSTRALPHNTFGSERMSFGITGLQPVLQLTSHFNELGQHLNALHVFKPLLDV